MHSEIKIFLCAVLVLGLFSCSSEKASDVSSGAKQNETLNVSRPPAAADSVQGKGQYSLRLVPLQATRNSTLSVIPQGFITNDAKIEWTVNGVPSVGSGSVFSASGTKKGDKVQAKAVVQGKEVASNVVEIRNAPPELSRVKIMPEVFKPGDTLRVEAAASDVDGDAVTILYEWTRNGLPAGTGSTIESSIKRGDKISIKVTPYDGESYGNPVMLKREILNLPPMIAEQYKFKVDERRWSCQVNATDPDGDTLAFSLKTAPPGMTINPATGLITWDVPRDFRGTASVTACVNDGHGGEATHTFNIDIRP